MKRKYFIYPLVIAFLSLAGCYKTDVFDIRHGSSPGKRISADVATDWYTLQLRLLLERNSALNGAYFGYIGIGLYEAVRPAIKNAGSFSEKLFQMPAMPEPDHHKSIDPEISANAAMASLLRFFNTGLTPANNTSIDSLENAYNERLKPAMESEKFARSQAFGRSIATAIYNWSTSDNFNPSNVGYVPPVFPGAWEPTPPAFANPVSPFVSSARPFLAEDATAKAPPFPAAYSETAGSDFYKIVKQVYDVSQALTDEEKSTALYWVDQGNGVGYTPPGHDFAIVTQALEQAGSDLAEAAEVYAKAGIAERDATIVCFRSKYIYNMIRPVTYIRRFIDPNWLPFIVTPPHPEYPAAHAYITGSVMEAAQSVLGGHLQVTDASYVFRGWAPRTFDNLFAAGEEAGISRLYGGIHYLPSINTGLSLGHDLGRKIGRIKVRN